MHIKYVVIMEKTVQVPEGVEVGYRDKTIAVRGPKGELTRVFSNPNIKIAIKGMEVKISSESERRKEKALVGTWTAHIRNMITGVTKGWEVRLKIVYSHFPMKFAVDGNRISIQNFLGSKNSKSIDIPEGIKVKNDKDTITVSGIDKEGVGQFSGYLETITRISGYDRRVFQDGIYITQKASPREE